MKHSTRRLCAAGPEGFCRSFLLCVFILHFKPGIKSASRFFLNYSLRMF